MQKENMHRGTWLGEKNKVNGRSTMVSTLTHTTREVAIDFLGWREEQKQQSMIGHNGCPFDDELDPELAQLSKSLEAADNYE